MAAVYFLYLAAAFEVVLFRWQNARMASALPVVKSLLARLGMEDYIERDQTNRCTESHPGKSCHQNAAHL